MKKNSIYKTDYSRSSFWITSDKISNDKKYYIKIHDELIEVNKEVYAVIFNSYRNELSYNRRHQSQVSLENNNLYGFDYKETLPSDENVEKEVLDQIEFEKIMQIIKSFDKKDQMIFKEYFINGTTISELSKMLKISQPGVSKRKNNILKKIKENYEKGL